jgi:hypothetical protein
MDTTRPIATFDYIEDQLAVIRREINISSYAVIKGIMGRGVVEGLPLRVRCECSKLLCEEIIKLNLSNRRALRKDYPRGFIIVPAHGDPSRDVIVFKTSKYHVVEIPQFTETATDL